MRVGYELEFFVARAAAALEPAHQGPAYSPHALLAIDEFVAQLLRDLDANGLQIGQLHAEYGLSQVELSLADGDPVARRRRPAARAPDDPRGGTRSTGCA